MRQILIIILLFSLFTLLACTKSEPQRYFPGDVVITKIGNERGQVTSSFTNNGTWKY